MNPYRHIEWVNFRNEVIKLHGGMCARCGRSRQDGVILQVHHANGYVSGRKPWEYGHTECEALCKGCHAQEHGKVMPQSGWDLIGCDDLGDVGGNCELCGTDIRYIYAISHESWGSMAVGTDCCDRLTGSAEASEHHARHLKTVDMRKRFVNSKRWQYLESGAIKITRKGITVLIHSDGDKFIIQLNDVIGREKHDSLLDAKIKAFEVIESGEASEFLNRRREKQRAKLREELLSLRGRRQMERLRPRPIHKALRRLG